MNPFRRERPERSPAARVPGLSSAAWLPLLLLSMVWLAALLVTSANPPRRDEAGWLRDAVNALCASPVALTVAAFLGLIAALYCARRLLLRRLARKPGPIEVPDFEAGRAVTGAHAPRVTELSSLFRERLAAVNLQSPEAVPAAPENHDFLQLLSAAASTPGNVLGTIVGLLVSTLPKSAYRVRGTLLRRLGERPCGVAVQVVTAPRFASRPMTVWAATWEQAVEQAAYEAAAYLLPRTNDCLRPPWTDWRGIAMPAALVEHGTRATDAAAARRYDPALAAYYDAVGADPGNLQLRLEIGALQEKLALWLDAFATYHDIVRVAERTKPPLGLRRRRRAARKVHGRVLIVARYRRAILLGFGERLAGDWCERMPTAHNHLVRKERAELRERLRHVFAYELARDAELRDTSHGRRLTALLSRAGVAADARDEVRLRWLCANASERQLEDIAGMLRRHRAQRRNAAGLTRRGVRVAQAWARLRARRAEHLLDGRALPTPQELESEVDKRLRGSRVGRRHWLDEYSAACTYALGLLDDPVELRVACGRSRTPPYSKEARETFCRLSVQRLEQAVFLLDSGALARRRDWILSEDPDLAGLRDSRRFRRFEARYMPHDDAVPVRPRKVHYLELAHYTSDLLRLIARERAAEWHARCADKPDARLARRWLEDEATAMAAFRTLACEHRHWQTRARVLAELDCWVRGCGRELPEVAHRDYATRPIRPRGGRRLDAAADARLSSLDDAARWAMRQEARITHRPRVAHHDAWLIHLRSSARFDAVLLCSERAGWWEWLHAALAPPADGRAWTAPVDRPRLRGLLDGATPPRPAAPRA